MFHKLKRVYFQEWFSLIYKTGRDGRCPQAESKPSNVTCNEGLNTCLDGSCTGSICALYGTNECECRQDRDEMCHVCCNSSHVSDKDFVRTKVYGIKLKRLLQFDL